ncbi:hypothetical protein LZZ90_01885 [Flavobacterium sp. SM15]|uniref:hypothetical protein n=1 Tax=Flavobacterium sp. SM15 TaxID=2908005 RepID=UPI001ED9F3AF|nr:hypothetical protein [Flavobacterium sp. SM15]MCG2610253.1 hypothetical protein [Flavobacterium sp. SM15]
MKTFTLIASVAVLCFSCQKEAKPSDKIDGKISDSIATNMAEEKQIQQNPQPIQNQQIQAQPQTISTTTVAPATRPGMNPPHGQPGHRCDIPVGAPLSSKPTAAKNTTTTTNTNATRYTVSSPNSQSQNAGAETSTMTLPSANITPMKPEVKAQTTAPGMQGKPNPAHGEEGHRCDIPVGVNLP